MSKFGCLVPKKKLEAYIYSRLPGLSIYMQGRYVLACKALAKDGHPMPVDMSPKGWVNRNAHLIIAFYNKIKKDKSDLYIKSATTKRPALVDPKTDAFLDSFQWRQVRMIALKKYSPRCMCCGATPADGATMNVDHIKPRKLFPNLALDINNLQILCNPCNHGKGNWDQTDWRPKIS